MIDQQLEFVGLGLGLGLGVVRRLLLQFSYPLFLLPLLLLQLVLWLALSGQLTLQDVALGSFIV